MIYTVKGFSVVNETEIDVFLKFPCFLYNPRNIGKLISSSPSSVMSMCKVVILGCWKRVFAMTSVYPWQNSVRLCLCFVHQGQTCLLLQVSLDFPRLNSNPVWWIGHLFLVLVLGGLLGLYRTDQLQLLQHQWLGHRLELCWIVCLGNEQRSFCFFQGFS